MKLAQRVGQLAGLLAEKSYLHCCQQTAIEDDAQSPTLLLGATSHPKNKWKTVSLLP